MAAAPTVRATWRAAALIASDAVCSGAEPGQIHASGNRSVVLDAAR